MKTVEVADDVRTLCTHLVGMADRFAYALHRSRFHTFSDTGCIAMDMCCARTHDHRLLTRKPNGRRVIFIVATKIHDRIGNRHHRRADRCQAYIRCQRDDTRLINVT
ncbi:hypothetical protein EN41_07205 [Agrobacterium tumefaciens]|nr:hypothetical protein EN41_07205 [Agrobacterium tumefaciens]